MPTFKIEQGAEIADWMRRGFATAARLGALSTAVRLVGIIQGEIIPSLDPPPIDKRIFVGSWRVDPKENGAEVVGFAPHAIFIDKGVRGESVKIGKALIDALAEWAMRKGIAGPTKTPAQRAKARAESVQIAWAIAKNMQKRGIFNGGKGMDVTGKASARVPAILQAEFARELKKAFAKGG